MSKIENGTQVLIEGYGGVATVVGSDVVGTAINGAPIYRYGVQFGVPPKGTVHEFFRGRMVTMNEQELKSKMPKTEEQELADAIALLKEVGLIA